MKTFRFKIASRRIKTYRLIALAGFFALLSACTPATTGLAPSGALRQQLADLRQQQQLQARQLEQIKQQLALLQPQTAVTDSASVSALTRQDLQLPEVIPTPQTTKPGVELQEPTSAVSEVQTVAASASSYLAAFSDLASGRWAEAEAGFQNFLTKYSDHQYAPNARYWLASAQLSQGKTKTAISNLQQVVADPRGQAKAPAALLQLERLYRRQGWTAQADEIAEQIRNRFPDSSEAQLLYQDSEYKN